MSETFTVTVEPLEREVECRSDQSILDACLRAGVYLPHACTHGTCGTCKLQVLEGDIEHNDASDFALMEFERNEGMALVCVATPSSDVTVEADVEAEQGVVHHPVRDFTGTVASIEDIARETRRLIVDLDEEMTFNPGQYVTVEIPGTGPDTYLVHGQPACRAGADRAADPAHARWSPAPTGGSSRTWPFGDTVRPSGPYGRFFPARGPARNR